MIYIATLTSKRQLTLPSKLTQKLNLKPGEKITITEENGHLVMIPAVKLVEELAGSLKVPSKFQGLNTNQIIEKAKKEYFAK